MSGLNLPNIFKKRVVPVPLYDTSTTTPAFPPPEFEIPYWLTIALTQVGTTEIVGPSGSNSKIEEYLEVVGMPADDDIAWCAAFANWNLVKAGYKGTGKANAQSFLHDKNFIKLAEPRLGCIVVLKRGTEPWMGHVGFWLDMHKKYIRLLGGNQSNRVGINNYKDDNDTVMGYFWPKAA